MNKTFGEFLREKRIEKNLTQKSLAQILIVSDSAVSKWEKNVAYPDSTLLPKLAQTLGVTEHELITASVDDKANEERIQAKKWRTLSFTWSLFFYIAYVVALIPCFICNLAIDKGLTWFWIVLAALVLAFTFTNLPKLIKKHKFFLLPLCMFLALTLLLGVCCMYTKGDWFFVSTISVLLGLVIIFMPIYIAKCPLFAKIKKYNDFVSVGIDFVLLNVLLIVIDGYTVTHGASAHWYFNVALPIVVAVYVALNVLLSVRFLRVNKILKTSVVLFLVNAFLYLPPLFIQVDNPSVQVEINSMNVFKADFSNWAMEVIETNVHCIICLALLLMGGIFLGLGLVKANKAR